MPDEPFSQVSLMRQALEGLAALLCFLIVAPVTLLILSLTFQGLTGRIQHGVGVRNELRASPFSVHSVVHPKLPPIQ